MVHLPAPPFYFDFDLFNIKRDLVNNQNHPIFNPLELAVELSPGERLDEVNADIRLIQKEKGLTFGTDAFLLAAFLRPAPHTHAVELGSGTGIIPLLLLSHKKIKSVTAVEIQPQFAELIARNAKINGYENRLLPLCADVRDLSPMHLGGEVGLVFSNPPYLKVGNGKANEAEEKYIARHEVCGSIFDFCAAAGRILRHGGRFVTVWRPDRLADLFSALKKYNLEPKRMTMVFADEGQEPCMVLTEAVKGGSAGMRVTPPLILYQPIQHGAKSRELTLRAQEVYRTCHLYDTEQKPPLKGVTI